MWPYMTRVSKKVATSKIEWLIKKLQLILTNLFLTNKPQKDPLNCQKLKKNTIFSALGVDRDLGFSLGPQTQFFPSFCILPIPLIHQKLPRNTPKIPRNPENLRKSNISDVRLDRDQRFSRGLEFFNFFKKYFLKLKIKYEDGSGKFRAQRKW